MKLADEIRGMITGFPKPLDADNAPYSEGFMTATIKAAQLVEKREYEREVSLIELINDSESKDPFFAGWNCAIQKVLDVEANQ